MIWRTVEHLNFRIPGIARGAFGKSGHLFVLGVHLHWSNSTSYGYEIKRSIVLWGLIGFVHEDTRNGLYKACRPGWHVTFPKIRGCRLRWAEAY